MPTEYKDYLCYHLDNLGEQYIDLGRLTDGLPHYQRSLRISRELSGAHPESRYHVLELVKSLVALGNVRRMRASRSRRDRCLPRRN